VDAATCPRELEVTAWTADGLIMGLRHRTLLVEGVQFHPESILTQSGKALLANFFAQLTSTATKSALIRS
jgi:anthranilate/para-aminobenzoate synthase component II